MYSIISSGGLELLGTIIIVYPKAPTVPAEPKPNNKRRHFFINFSIMFPSLH